jgi:PPOX class probable F420-dependent enzyme
VSLTAEETARLAGFLGPPKIAVVATVGDSGIPQLTPNWYAFHEGRLVVSTTKETVKYRNLTRDRRVTVCVYSELLAANYVTVSGDAEVLDDESIWPITQAIVDRYLPSEKAEARMRELRRQNRIIISLEPQRMVFRP